MRHLPATAPSSPCPEWFAVPPFPPVAKPNLSTPQPPKPQPLRSADERLSPHLICPSAFQLSASPLRLLPTSNRTLAAMCELPTAPLILLLRQLRRSPEL